LPLETHARDAQNGTHGGGCTAHSYASDYSLHYICSSLMHLCSDVRTQNPLWKALTWVALILPRRSARRFVMHARRWITAMTLLHWNLPGERSQGCFLQLGLLISYLIDDFLLLFYLSFHPSPLFLSFFRPFIEFEN